MAIFVLATKKLLFSGLGTTLSRDMSHLSRDMKQTADAQILRTGEAERGPFIRI